MQNQNPKSLPRITPSSHISLTDLEISLLQQVFGGYSEIFLEQEFGGGYSGARVFLILAVRPNGVRDARVVTKIGPADKLCREFENYHKYAGPALPFSTAQVKEPSVQAEQAALNYIFVGDADLGKSMSLEDYYLSHEVEQVIKTLENLFDKALGRMWYGQSQPLTCRFEDEYGRHLPSREDLEEIVQKIFPMAVSQDGSQVTLPGVLGSFPNPLAVYPGLLDKILKGRKSFVHGDLHLQNVLVDESGKAWLIDFAKVRERHNLFDFIKLEVYIRLMALAKQQGAFWLGEYAHFEEELNNAALGRSVEAPSNPKLKFAFQIIFALRELAGNYLADRHSFKQEYLSALFLYVLAMMKYYPSSGEEATRLIFITTCVCAKSLLEEEVMSNKAEHPGSPKQADPDGINKIIEINTGGGAYIGGNVTAGRDVIMGNQVHTISVGNIDHATGVAIGMNAQANLTQTTGETGTAFLAAFTLLLEKVQEMNASPAKTMAETAVQGLRTEAAKGPQADEKNVGKWLNSLAKIAPDIWEVAINTFVHPIQGLSTVFQKIARRAREEQGN